MNNYYIFRPCNIYLLPFFIFFFTRLKKINLLVEEVNTFYFFSKFFARANKKFLFFHQLTKKIWFIELNFFLGFFGYIYEIISLKLIKNSKIITISDSTKMDLIAHGLNEKNINVINQVINFQFIQKNKRSISSQRVNLFYLGSLRKMKNVREIIEIYNELDKDIFRLSIFSKEIKKIDIFKKKYSGIKNLKIIHEKNLSFPEYLEDQNIFLFTSIKEGWGLVISEMAALGIPSIAYNVTGVRDAIKNHITGLLIENNNKRLFIDSIIMLSKNKNLYEFLSNNCILNSIKIEKSDGINQLKNILMN